MLKINRETKKNKQRKNKEKGKEQNFILWVKR